MATQQTYAYEPDYAIPPGETLQETMVALGMTQQDLAERTDLTVQTLNRIFKGEQPITYETANKLEYVTGYTASFWNNLEAQYRAQLVKVNETRELEQNLEWLKSIPVKELKERGTLSNTTDKVVLYREAFRFYGVSSVESFRNVWDDPKAAARRSTAFASAPGPTSAWLRLGQITARSIACAPYNKPLFATNVKAIRALTLREPAEFLPEMSQLCAEAGVALTLVPEFKKAPWSGAAEWLSPQKAMILLCLRGKSEDKFWFTFFHEASHILHDGKTKSFLDDEKSEYGDDPSEKRADAFAAEMLIPCRHNARIMAIQSKSEVGRIAKELGVSSGIVVGRYQYLTKQWNFFNDLKKKFDWVKEV
jgi:addiction module HigA family antidote